MEERSRHMLQTTHQLKAPFAAVHANTQLLLGGYCGELPEPSAAIVEKITARCAVLSQQILEMLQFANLRSEAQSPSAKPWKSAEHRCSQPPIARVEPTAAAPRDPISRRTLSRSTSPPAKTTCRCWSTIC